MPPRRSSRKGSAAPSNASQHVDDQEEEQEEQEQEQEQPQQEEAAPIQSTGEKQQEEEEDQLEVENDFSNGANKDLNGDPTPTSKSQQLPFSTMRLGEDGDEESKVKILVATDNHVGFLEKDPIRGEDSFKTFEEILHLAKKHDVDMILLGGDLFHDNKPSRATLHRVLGLLRENTFSEKPVSIKLLSDPWDNAPSGYSFPAVNYEDHNLNVGIPVFSIHGNHDDPQGVGTEGALSALDILSVAGLVNYFGKIELPTSDSKAKESRSKATQSGLSEDGIRIRPVLFQKGETKICLYGMGNVKDERLHYELRSSRVRMFKPKEHDSEWFNILCVHQNRVAHNPKSYVPDGMFDDSIDLVIWGHEHEQLLHPEVVADKSYRICQPGSSVATSLCQAETVSKQVGLLSIHGRTYKMEPLPLKTVRPFVMDTLDLTDEADLGNVDLKKRESVQKLLRQKVNELIDQANDEWQQAQDALEEEERMEKRPLPLIRLKVVYAPNDLGNPIRFGQEFSGKIANPKDVLAYSKKTVRKVAADQGEFNEYQPIDEDMVPEEKMAKLNVGEMVKNFLSAQNMDFLSSVELTNAVEAFVDKDAKTAIGDLVNKKLKKAAKTMGTDHIDDNAVDRQMADMRQKRAEEDEAEKENQDEDEEMEDASTSKVKATGKGRKAAVESDDSMAEDLNPNAGGGDEMSDEERSERSRSASPAKGAKKGNGKAAAPKAKSPAKKSAAKAKQAPLFKGQLDDDDSDIEMTQGPAPTSGRGSAFAKKPAPNAAARKTPAKKATPGGSSSLRQSALDFSGSSKTPSVASGRQPRKAAATFAKETKKLDDYDEEDIVEISD